MSPRELIIFLLGLAIVAVVLRGLYVALQARRGQIKLAIDKNIPQDVDLEALELAELPGGGARVVERSLAAVNSQNSAIEAANARAASLGLDSASRDEETIPVLMDPVELNSQQESITRSKEVQFSDDFAERAEAFREENARREDTRQEESMSFENSHDPQFPIGEDDSEFMTGHDGNKAETGDENVRVDDPHDFSDPADNHTREPNFQSSIQANRNSELPMELEPDIEPDIEPEYEDPDDVLFDYEEESLHSTSRRSRFQDDEFEDEEEDIEEERADPLYQEDGMASVMPDYPDDEWADDEEDEDEIPDGFHEEEFGGYSDDSANEWSGASHLQGDHEGRDEDELDEEFASDDEIIAAFKGRQSSLQSRDSEEDDFSDIDGYDFDDDELENELSAGSEHEDSSEERREPAIGASFEDSLEEFSMTAGERIGFNEAAKTPTAQQSELFDEDDALGSEAEATEKTGLRSLFSTFGRSKKQSSEPGESEDSVTQPEDQIESSAEYGTAERPEENADERSLRAREIEAISNPQATDSENVYGHAGSIAEQEDGTEREELFTQDDVQEAGAIQQSEVLVVNVMARDGYAINGNNLLQVLVTSGLKFGEMNIFHHRLGNEDRGAVVFSVANILNPGTFDLNDMANFSTPGVSLFLALPSPMNNLKAFEHMLEVAQHLRGALDGELKDDHRNVMTAQTIEHYRQRIRDFELRQLKAAGTRA